MNRKLQYGFSLVELLVVISIIAILAAVGLASYVQAGRSARDAKRRSDVETVRQALILYRSETGGYPTGIANDTFAEVVTTLTTADYLANPAPSGAEYTYLSTATQFCVCADIENANGNYGSAANAGCYASTLSSTTGGFYCANQP